eukprot:TRINITY_DN2967_c0_g1_i1.p1 TRINITY_DN2967_c0_g1~~TRINITY_DN2967_c0_g1_i1.p1  ORF type:complete len:150 (+),score=15.61 TRINITY_DN2967_c0_g1_i1:53-502(+)
MKFQCAVPAFAALLTRSVFATSFLHGRETPDETKLDMEFRAQDSFGKTALTPPCDKVQCGEYSCPTPFELKMDDTCCGYCWAPDHVVAADRHVATAYNSTGNAVEQCEGAPSTCKGPGVNAVRCFAPSCRAGEKPHCAPGACCAKCSKA